MGSRCVIAPQCVWHPHTPTPRARTPHGGLLRGAEIQGMRPILKRRVAKDGEGVNGRPLVAIAGMLTVHLSVNIHRDLRWIADGNEHFATDHRRGWDR